MQGVAGFTKETLKRFHQSLKMISLPVPVRKKIMLKVLRTIKDNAKKNVTRQTDPDNRPWKPRKKQKKGKVKNKMLRKRGIYLKTTLKQQGNVGELLGARDSFGSQISAVHQYGLEVAVKLSKKDKDELAKLLAKNKEPATHQQAKRLRELGYRPKVSSKGKTKKATLKGIKATLSRGKAGLIIRKMEEKQGIKIRRGVKSYKMAKRTFLDENKTRTAQIITETILRICK